MKLTFCILLITLNLNFATTASANSLATLPDRTLVLLIEQALRQVHTLKCETDFCARTTDAELAKPPITIEDARRAAVAAGDSAASKWCGIKNHERIFLGYIGYQKLVLKYNDRQLHLLSTIHGTVQGYAGQAFQKMGQCPAAMREHLESVTAKTINKPQP